MPAESVSWARYYMFEFSYIAFEALAGRIGRSISDKWLVGWFGRDWGDAVALASCRLARHRGNSLAFDTPSDIIAAGIRCPVPVNLIAHDCRSDPFSSHFCILSAS